MEFGCLIEEASLDAIEELGGHCRALDATILVTGDWTSSFGGVFNLSSLNLSLAHRRCNCMYIVLPVRVLMFSVWCSEGNCPRKQGLERRD